MPYYPSVTPAYPMLVSQSGAIIALLDDIALLEWTRNYTGPNTFTLKIDRTSAHAKLIEPLQIVVAPDEPAAAFIIENISVNIAQGSNTLTAKGRSMDGWLDDPGRIALPPTGASHDAYTNVPAETVIRTVVRKCAGNLALAARQFPNFSVAATDGSRGALTTISLRYQPVMKVISEIAQLNALGWEVTYDRATKQHTFDVISGDDHSADVFFDVAFNTINELNWERTQGDRVSYVYAAGQGEGAARTVVERWEGQTALDPAPTGLNRKETFMDTRDLSDTYAIATRADATISENRSAETISVSVSRGGSFNYREHWDLGDIVTVRDAGWGLERIAQITGIAFRIDNTSLTPDISVDIGDVPPTLKRRVEQQLRSVSGSGRV